MHKVLSFRGHTIHILVDRKKLEATIVPTPDVLSPDHTSLEIQKHTFCLASV